MINTWGPLGNPTKEEIQKWWELPYGKFTELVKDRSRTRGGKTKREHTVYVTKRVYQDYVAEVKVMAFNPKDAIVEATNSPDLKKIVYPSTPKKTGEQRFFGNHLW